MGRWTIDGLAKRVGAMTDPQVMRLLAATPPKDDAIAYATAVASLTGRLTPQSVSLIAEAGAVVVAATREVYAAYGPTKPMLADAAMRVTAGLLACLVSDRISTDTYVHLITPIAWAFRDEWESGQPGRPEDSDERTTT